MFFFSILIVLLKAEIDSQIDSQIDSEIDSEYFESSANLQGIVKKFLLKCDKNADYKVSKNEICWDVSRDSINGKAPS